MCRHAHTKQCTSLMMMQQINNKACINVRRKTMHINDDDAINKQTISSMILQQQQAITNIARQTMVIIIINKHTVDLKFQIIKPCL